MGFNKGLAVQQHFFVFKHFKHFKTPSIDNSFGYKVVDLTKLIKFCIGYFLEKVVVVKAHRVENMDIFYVRSVTPEY